MRRKSVPQLALALFSLILGTYAIAAFRWAHAITFCAILAALVAGEAIITRRFNDTGSQAHDGREMRRRYVDAMVRVTRVGALCAGTFTLLLATNQGLSSPTYIRSAALTVAVVSAVWIITSRVRRDVARSVKVQPEAE